MNKDEKYLGSPLALGRWKSTSFDSLVLKIRPILNSWKSPLLSPWKSPHLSQDGRNNLVKSITLGISIYNMSVLKLPKDTNNQIDKLRRKFWLEEDEKIKIHTIKWKEICKPMSEGGPGIRDNENNNMALLAKTC